MNRYYKYQRTLPVPDYAKKDSIIANACQHFNISAEDLQQKRCMISKAVMYAVYKEALHRHQLTSEAFGNPYAQYSFRAMMSIEEMIRKRQPGYLTILGFYEKYGYCKGLWVGRKVA